jgi:diacylglycerol kinase
MESRSSLVAPVRVAMIIFVSLRVVLFWLGYRMLEWAEVAFLIACASLILSSVNSGLSNAVDIFNVTSGKWSTATLSEARETIAATSLPNLAVAIFAGGLGTC